MSVINIRLLGVSLSPAREVLRRQTWLMKAFRLKPRRASSQSRPVFVFPQPGSFQGSVHVYEIVPTSTQYKTIYNVK